MKAKRFNFGKPWFTKGLAKSIRKRNMLYQSFLNNPNSSNENVNISRTKTNLLILFELLSVYIMKNKVKNLNQMSKPLGKF